MCTVTIVPCHEAELRQHIGQGVRLACNRDELLLRPAALPPQVRGFGARLAILPIDPVSNGTWIGVNDAGLAMVLLNVNAPTKAQGSVHPRNAPPASRSRGTIIPGLLHCESLRDATRLAARLPAADYSPFRLVLIESREVAVAHSDGHALQIVEHPPLAAPLLFTSSGLGDHFVEDPRRSLFERFFPSQERWESRQDAYHRHHWPDRTHLSVCMNRPDARTVNHTVIRIREHDVALTYWPDAPDRPVQPVSITLELQPMRVPCSQSV